ncbi:hypothetical protein BJY01DRAFT_241646 [Aspergillus pseudoustus]|uniref:PiggyBac transposable element-derived protein domain-containing protein n=1 Tax=Aspergillus pseudoustus TaxID=1810923 RepID=A0ABR4IAQ6_9EURO
MQKWYQWYLCEVKAGRLELPEYKEITDCSKHNYKITNNICSHIISHKNISLATRNHGGRALQEYINKAASIFANYFLTTWQVANKRLEWYKGLFARVPPNNSAGTATATGTNISPARNSLPALPKKKDGIVHVTNIRAKVTCMGHSMPCSSCGTRVNYYKDINKCNHFVLFNYGNLHPHAATKEPKIAGNKEEEATT